MSKNMHFPLRKHKKTCFNSFAAVSTAPMPSYGAFCAEFHALHKEHSKPHAAREKHAKEAHKKWRAARATQHTTQTPYQIPLAESSTYTQWANFWIRTLHSQIRSSAAADLTQTLHTSSLASPQATF